MLELIRLAALSLFLTVAPVAVFAQTPLTSVLVANLPSEAPVIVTHAPGDFSRVFIGTLDGRVFILSDGTVLPQPFLDIDAISLSGSETGLLGLAFHPSYQSNGEFFVHYSDNNGNNVIARYLVSADADVADAGSEQIVMTFDQPFTNHNGGWIGFGMDGYLYIASGDGGSGNDPDNHAQDTTSDPLGKMLRIDVDGDDFPTDPVRNYAIPPTNPFVGTTSDDEIFAYGLRNPWRASFDRGTGDLYIGDVGQSAREEIDILPASSGGGENYGWRCMEGTTCTGLSGCACNDPSLELPVHEYSHTSGNCSVTGGNVYRGCEVSDLQGTYFFADYCTADIWSFAWDGATANDLQDRTSELDPAGSASISLVTTFGEDAYGEIYVAEQGGEVFKIVPNTAGPETDCNANGVEDACELADGSAADGDENGVPDECEAAPVACGDIRSARGRCTAAPQGNRLTLVVLLNDTSHDGETVAVTLDGNLRPATVMGRRARLMFNRAGAGDHSVELVEPAGCSRPPVTVTCP